jgi:hypothetical protein
VSSAFFAVDFPRHSVPENCPNSRGRWKAPRTGSLERPPYGFRAGLEITHFLEKVVEKGGNFEIEGRVAIKKIRKSCT